MAINPPNNKQTLSTPQVSPQIQQQIEICTTLEHAIQALGKNVDPSTLNQLHKPVPNDPRTDGNIYEKTL